MQFTITINGESVTLQGVSDGATIDLTPQSAPSTVREVRAVVPVATEDVRPDDVIVDTEPTPSTTIAPKGVNRSERKRTQSKPQSKSGPIKAKGADPLKGKGKRTPSAAQQAGWAKTRHGKHASVRTATEWLALCIATEDADRIKACKAELKAGGFKVSKANKVTA